MTNTKDSALIIVGHGSTQNPDSSAPTFEHAATIRDSGHFKEVHCAFWKEEPSLRQVLYMVDSEIVYVVPNFISEGYFTRTVIPRELDLTGATSTVGEKVIHYCEPVGNHPKVTQLLLKRAREVAGTFPLNESSLLIVGHGTNLNDNSALAAKREVEKIRELGIFGEVLNTYMEEAPLIAEWDTLTQFQNVVVVPFFIADGLHSYQDIPVLLGIESETGSAASQRDVFRNNPYHLRKKNLAYASAIGTEPDFAQVILDQVALFNPDSTETP